MLVVFSSVCLQACSRAGRCQRDTRVCACVNAWMLHGTGACRAHYRSHAAAAGALYYYIKMLLLHLLLVL